MKPTKYYIQKPGTNDFGGTYTLSEIRQELAARHITAEWHAIESTGQTYRQLVRATGWVPISTLLDEPESSREQHSSSAPPPRKENHATQEPHVSDDVVHARTLGLRGRVTFEEIKRTYRQRMLEYHPDRVAGLGPKLRALAEAESKAINAAYEYFRRKYGGGVSL